MGGVEEDNPPPSRGRSQLPLPKPSTSALQATYLLEPQFPHLRRTCPPVLRPPVADVIVLGLNGLPPGDGTWASRILQVHLPRVGRAPSRTWPGAQVCRDPWAQRGGAARTKGRLWDICRCF